MSFASKPTRPDSKETAALRKEYEKKSQEYRESREPASKAKAKDDKQKLFGRIVDQMAGERREHLEQVHKHLIGIGKLKSKEQVEQERAQVQAKREATTR